MEKNVVISVILLVLFWLAGYPFLGFILALITLLIPLEKKKPKEKSKGPKVEPIIVEKEYEGTIYPEKLTIVYGKPKGIKMSLEDSLKGLGKAIGWAIRKIFK